MLSIGLMSGTSMDGIDAGLLRTNGTPDVLDDLGHFSLAYHPNFKVLLKAAEKAVKSNRGNIDNANNQYPKYLSDYLSELQMNEESRKSKEIELLDYLNSHLEDAYKLKSPSQITQISLKDVINHSTYLHVIAVRELLAKTNFQAEDISLIGYHGQTLFHSPANKISIIVGDCQLMANMLNIRVIGNFREKDIQAGGQGAPFAPLYHQALALKHHHHQVAFVNCGGISNITLINGDNIMAYDCGPGNGLLDNLVRNRTQGKEHMDVDGKYGNQGQVNESVLKSLYEKSILKDGTSYFTMNPPKSLDIGDMKPIAELDLLSLEDACATLAAFTADTIISSLQLVDLTTYPVPSLWILCGGGWYNPVIRRNLTSLLTDKYNQNIIVKSADEMGWNNQSMEALIFAYLAVLSYNNKPISIPTTTGVSHPMHGGDCFLPK